MVPITVAPGADIVRDFEMTAVAPAAASGLLSIATEPPGARVTIDGQPSGTSPVTLDALTAGKHTIAVASATGSAERTVTVVAGQTASVVFSLPKVSGPVGGWLSVSVPFDVQVVERGEVIGASGAARIMLAAGRHDIVLVNRTLEYQEAAARRGRRRTNHGRPHRSTDGQPECQREAVGGGHDRRPATSGKHRLPTPA